MSYAIFGIICVTVLKELNNVVHEPYMDEPFHVPQAQAYCRGDFMIWDPKITTPPGLYVLSYILKYIFMFKCTLPMLRLTPLLSLLALPLVLTRLLYINQRIPAPSSFFSPTLESLVVSSFPVAWFFGFLYYTELPSLVFVVWTVLSALHGKHWQAALAGFISCSFRQTNIIWLIYAYAVSQISYLRFRRETPHQSSFHDPPASVATPYDLFRMAKSIPGILPDILPSFIPYSTVLAFFILFVVWNGGIVLGDKSNHIPSFHIPQVYYFFAFATALGWPVLVSAPGGSVKLIREICRGIIGGRRQILATAVLTAIMCVTVHYFTIHHPFLLSDNRHYTFYVWRRIYMLHPLVPHLLVPGYIACAWAWFARIAPSQTLSQTLVLPMFMLPTLLPTPLLEPRYFLIPYILLRAQVPDVPTWGVVLEGVWYAAINAATMWIFLYKDREGVGRFMW